MPYATPTSRAASRAATSLRPASEEFQVFVVGEHELFLHRWGIAVNKQFRLAPGATNGDFSEMLANDGVNVVAVLTNGSGQSTLIAEILRNNKHVITTMPVPETMSLDDFDHLARVARVHHRTLMVAQPHVYSDAMIATRRMVEAGTIGQPKFIVINCPTADAGQVAAAAYVARHLTGMPITDVSCTIAGEDRSDAKSSKPDSRPAPFARLRALGDTVIGLYRSTDPQSPYTAALYGEHGAILRIASSSRRFMDQPTQTLSAYTHNGGWQPVRLTDGRTGSVEGGRLWRSFAWMIEGVDLAQVQRSVPQRIIDAHTPTDVTSLTIPLMTLGTARSALAVAHAYLLSQEMGRGVEVEATTGIPTLC